MKKILYTFCLLLVFVCKVRAFEIDMSKIEVASKNYDLINELDSRFIINTDGFRNSIINDKVAINYISKIVDISFSNKDEKKLKNTLSKYLYLSDVDGFETLSSVVYLDNYIKQIVESNIELGRIKDIKTIDFDTDNTLIFVYVDNALVDNEKQNITLSYWLKRNDDSYKIYYPWICLSNDVNDFFEKVGYAEERGEVVANIFNTLSFSSNENTLNKDKISTLYTDNKDSVVQLTSMSDSTYESASGFFIKEGVVVTSWSFFMKYLIDGNYLYVNNTNGDTYEVLGVVSADPIYDIVVLKLNDEVGKKVVFGNRKEIKTNDELFVITSRNNGNFSIKRGKHISIENDKLRNLFLLSSSDVGSALFNEYGEVIGVNVEDKINSELSYANSTDYLKSLQKTLEKCKYNKISYTYLDKFKKNYYLEYSQELESKNVTKDEWNNYIITDKLEDTITMKLIKASYVDNILSLRYENNASGMLDSIYLASEFTQELLKEGYNLTYYNEQKTIYKNDEYQVILKDNMNYLIILIMEI